MPYIILLSIQGFRDCSECMGGNVSEVIPMSSPFKSRKLIILTGLVIFQNTHLAGIIKLPQNGGIKLAANVWCIWGGVPLLMVHCLGWTCKVHGNNLKKHGNNSPFEEDPHHTQVLLGGEGTIQKKTRKWIYRNLWAFSSTSVLVVGLVIWDDITLTPRWSTVGLSFTLIWEGGPDIHRPGNLGGSR